MTLGLGPNNIMTGSSAITTPSKGFSNREKQLVQMNLMGGKANATLKPITVRTHMRSSKSLKKGRLSMHKIQKAPTKIFTGGDPDMKSTLRLVHKIHFDDLMASRKHLFPK